MKKITLAMALLLHSSLSFAENFINFDEFYEGYDSIQVECNNILVFDDNGTIESIHSKLCSYQPISQFSNVDGNSVLIQTEEFFVVDKGKSVLKDDVTVKRMQIPETKVVTNAFKMFTGDTVFSINSSSYRGYILRYLGEDVDSNHVFKVIETNKFSKNKHKMIKVSKGD